MPLLIANLEDSFSCVKAHITQDLITLINMCCNEIFMCFRTAHSPLHYSKCSKISNTFHFLSTNKMLVIRTGFQK